MPPVAFSYRHYPHLAVEYTEGPHYWEPGEAAAGDGRLRSAVKNARRKNAPRGIVVVVANIIIIVFPQNGFFGERKQLER